MKHALMLMALIALAGHSHAGGANLLDSPEATVAAPKEGGEDPKGGGDNPKGGDKKESLPMAATADQ